MEVSAFHSIDYELLMLASKARFIENKPSKKELAEKALMAAYMKGLEEVYGQVQKKGEERKESDVQTSEKYEDRNVYQEMLESTSDEMR